MINPNLYLMIINWALAKLDKYGVKVIKGFEYDENSRDWATRGGMVGDKWVSGRAKAARAGVADALAILEP